MTYRILIVEDEALIGLDLATAFEDEGFETVGVASDLPTALQMAEKGGIDLATMDVQLARNTDGVETAIKLWELHAIRSVFVSGSLDPKTRTCAAAARPIGFINKPIGSEAVVAFVKKHFSAENGA
ncbi:response regulator [Falsirhodobacter sp. 1013]|uniref:response regulator n=1 Tax=Falsirhodobacter sp. 1013 TaxID=3417566 RepID=UPI003EC124BD